MLFAGGFFLPILADPGFPAFAGGGVASGEGESGDVGIRDGNLLRRIFRDETHDRFREGRAIAAIEDVTLHARAVFAGDGHVATIVEGLLEGGAEFGFGDEVGNPTFDRLALAAIDNLEVVDGEVMLRFGHKSLFAFRCSLFVGILFTTEAQRTRSRKTMFWDCHYVAARHPLFTKPPEADPSLRL